MKRYNSFGYFIKELFGTRVYKVNVDAGFTCPNRDGTVGYGGCIYCNNDSFRPSSCCSIVPLEEQINKGIKYLKKRFNATKFIVYFQAYTNTYAPVEKLEQLYKKALQHSDVVGLAIGTRPDCVDEEKIKLLEELAKKYFILIEYGLQSIYEKTLQYINRGHDYYTFIKAIEMTNNKGIKIGAHIIVGFPTETKEEMLYMANAVSEMPIQFLKIHQLQVVKNTVLERYYKEKPFHVFDYEEYLDFIVRFIERLSPKIIIQRLFATAPDNILIAPKWGKNRQQVLYDIEKKLCEMDTYQGKLYSIKKLVFYNNLNPA